MKINRAILLSLLLACTSIIKAQERRSTLDSSLRHNLMPIPAAVEFRPGRLSINNNFKAAAKGYSDARLNAGIARALQRLRNRTGLDLLNGLSPDARGAVLLIECQNGGRDVPSVREDESYHLQVAGNQATLDAPTVVGVLRGLETFLQLVEGDHDGYYLPLVNIDDKPRFPWRGLLIDSARHFEPVEVIKRNLDGMAAVKLNVFHWHLTENQGFRIESLKFPKLHLMGSDGLYYTQEQVRDIIEYARQRAIRVVPEFDLPGHSTSWFVAYPDLASAPGPYQIERQFGIFDPAMDPSREDVYRLLDGFLGEMAALFPDEFIHIGGDEVNGKQWDANPRIQAFIKAKGLKDNHGLQAYFNQRLLKILQKHGKRMLGWDEILHPDLPKDIVVQSWRGQDSLADAARKGYMGILSAGYYLDLIQTTAQHYSVDPIATDSKLNSEETARVLGGEACMWGEYVNADTIDSRIWPRLAAIAERLWSPSTITDVNDMYRRLAAVSVELEDLGLTQETYQGKMLRRLSANSEVGPLKVLLDILEPVKLYNRGEQLPSTQLTPLTHLVDAARPDSALGREISLLVNRLLTDSPKLAADHERLSRLFTQWRDARPALDVMIERSPLLREARPLVGDLSEMGSIGLEALEYLSAGVETPAHWREVKLARLDEAGKPKAALEFAVIPALKQLVMAASEPRKVSSVPRTQ